MGNFISEDVGKLTSGRKLAKNTALNLFGQLAPLFVALFAIPIILKGIGVDRFGVLTLSWMTIGYFTLFDFGLGRALTKLVAEKLGQGKEDELPPLIWTASLLMLILGGASTIIFLAVTPWFVSNTLKVPPEILSETARTFYILSLSVPIIISTAGLRGVLEALQRFDLTTYVRIPMGIITFLGPILVLPFTKSVFWITVVLVIARILAWFAYAYLCMQVLPALKRKVVLEKKLIMPLVKFGGWMTVSNIVSPLMVSADRFIIGSLISISAVSYYSTSWEVVTKFLLIPASVIGVLFPAFSTMFSQQPRRAAQLYDRALIFIALIMLPIAVITILFAKTGLTLWLGAAFAEKSYRVMQVLALGVFCNGVAYLPFGCIQGIGRPDITAKLHVIEVILYMPCVFILIKYYGIVGAAIAWSLRACVDAVLLSWVAAIKLKSSTSVW